MCNICIELLYNFGFPFLNRVMCQFQHWTTFVRLLAQYLWHFKLQPNLIKLGIGFRQVDYKCVFKVEKQGRNWIIIGYRSQSVSHQDPLLGAFFSKSVKQLRWTNVDQPFHAWTVGNNFILGQTRKLSDLNGTAYQRLVDQCRFQLIMLGLQKLNVVFLGPGLYNCLSAIENAINQYNY